MPGAHLTTTRLDDLYGNVALGSLADGQVLTYDASSGLWKNRTVTAAQVTNAASLVAANTFTQGPNTFRTGGAGNVGVVVQGSLGQTAHLQQWQNYDGGVASAVDRLGYFAIGKSTVGSNYALDVVGPGFCLTTLTYGNAFVNTSNATYHFSPAADVCLQIRSYAVGAVPIVVQATPSQTANLQEWQNSSGTVLFSFNPDGTQITTAASGKIAIGGGLLQVSLQGTGLGNNVFAGQSAVAVGYNASAYTNSLAYGHSASAYPHTSAIALGRLAQTTANNQFMIGSASDPISQVVFASADPLFKMEAATNKFIIRGAPSQSANLQEWQDSSGTDRGHMTKDGQLVLNADSAVISQPLVIKAGGTTYWSLGFAGVEAGDFLTILNAGVLNLGGGVVYYTYSGTHGQVKTFNDLQLLPGSLGGTGSVKVLSQAASSTGLVVKGVPSQSANLQEWQDSSAAVLSSITSDGRLTLPSGAFATPSIKIGPGNGLYQTGGTALGFLISGVASMPAGVFGSANFTLAAGIGFGIAAGSPAAGGADIALTRSAVGVFKMTDGLSGLGALICGAPTASTVGLTIKGAPSQSANLQEWQNSSGTVKASIGPAGSLTMMGPGSSGTVMASFLAGSGTASTKIYDNGTVVIDSDASTGTFPLTVKYAGNVVAQIFYSGAIVGQSLYANATSGTAVNVGGGNLLFVMTGTTLPVQMQSYNELQVLPGAAGGSGTRRFSVISQNATDMPFAVKAAPSQSANLQEWQNSSGTALLAVTSTGQISAAGSLTISAGGVNTLQVGNDGRIRPLYGVIQAQNEFALSDTTLIWNLHSQLSIRWSSSGNYQAAAPDIGLTRGGAGLLSVTNGSAGLGALICGAPTASTVGLTIKGAPSQSANLQEWQNSSGTVLASVNSDGCIRGTAGNVTTPGLAFTTDPGTGFFNYNNGVGFSYQGGNYCTLDTLGLWMRSTGSVRWAATAGLGSYNPDTGLARSAAGVVTVTNGSSGSGSLLLTAASASTIPLTVKGAPSQSANLQEWQNSSGTVRAAVDTNGAFICHVTTDLTNALVLYGSGGNAYYSVQPGPGITQFTQSGTIIFTISGTFDLYKTLRFYGLSNGVITANDQNGVASHVTVKGGDAYGANSGANLYLTSGAKGSSGSDGNVYLNYDGTTVRGLTSVGLSTTPAGQLHVQALSAATKGLVVQGAPAQSANLLEVQDSNGTVLSCVSAAGNLNLKSADNSANYPLSIGVSATRQFNVRVTGSDVQLATTDNPITAYKLLYIDGNTVEINAFSLAAINLWGATKVTVPTASTVGLTVKAAPSQSANLQEWQNSSGTVLATVDAGGIIKVDNIQALGSVLNLYASTEILVSQDKAIRFGTSRCRILSGDGSTFNIFGGLGYPKVLLQDPTGQNGVGLYSFPTNVLTVTQYNGTGLGALVCGAPTASTVGLTVKAAPSQSVNLQEWQNSSSTVLLSVGPAGQLKANVRYGDITTDTDAATITFDLAVTNDHKVTLGGNRTLAVTNDQIGQSFVVILTQDGTGSRTVTWWSGIKWANGTPPTLTTTAGNSDVFSFYKSASGVYYGALAIPNA